MTYVFIFTGRSVQSTLLCIEVKLFNHFYIPWAFNTADVELIGDGRPGFPLLSNDMGSCPFVIDYITVSEKKNMPKSLINLIAM